MGLRSPSTRRRLFPRRRYPRDVNLDRVPLRSLSPSHRRLRPPHPPRPTSVPGPRPLKHRNQLRSPPETLIRPLRPLRTPSPSYPSRLNRTLRAPRPPPPSPPRRHIRRNKRVSRPLRTHPPSPPPLRFPPGSNGPRRRDLTPPRPMRRRPRARAPTGCPARGSRGPGREAVAPGWVGVGPLEGEEGALEGGAWCRGHCGGLYSHSGWRAQGYTRPGQGAREDGGEGFGDAAMEG